MSSKLYAIFASYTKGSKCLNLARSEVKQKDGFRLWKQLHQAGDPSSPKDKSALECILNYEELVSQFEELSGSDHQMS